MEPQEDGGFGYLRDDSRLPAYKTMSPKAAIRTYLSNITDSHEKQMQDMRTSNKAALDARLNRWEEDVEAGKTPSYDRKR